MNSLANVGSGIDWLGPSTAMEGSWVGAARISERSGPSPERSRVPKLSRLESVYSPILMNSLAKVVSGTDEPGDEITGVGLGASIFCAFLNRSHSGGISLSYFRIRSTCTMICRFPLGVNLIT